MIEAEEFRKLRELQRKVQCPKRFNCVYAALTELCAGHYHAELDILECLEQCEPRCPFARPFGGAWVCTCPLRKFIAQNFDRWSATETALLRRPSGE